MRPRTCSDEQILEAAANVVALKPADWTLSDVAGQVNLTAATLVQRFGSKQKLEQQLLAYLNDSDDFRSQSMVGDLIETSCKGRLKAAGLLTFRMIAATSRGSVTRSLARGARP